MRRLPDPLFSTTSVKLPLKTAIQKEIVCTQLLHVPLLLPHDCFKQVWKSGSFNRTICEGAAVLEAFWTDVGDHPSLQFHPVKSVPGYQRRAVPLILHGDGAAVTQSIGSGSKSCMFLSWRSLVARSKDNRDNHHLIGAIWSHLLVASRSFNTSNSFWRCVAKSFQQMFDEGGRDTGGYFGVVIFTTGDLEYFNSFQGQPRWNALRPCSLCSIDLHRIKDFKQVRDINADPWTSLPRRQSRPLFESLLSPTCISRPDAYKTSWHGPAPVRISSMGPDHASDGSRLYRGAFVCPAAGAQGRFLGLVSIFMFPVEFFNFMFCRVSIRIIVSHCGVDCACNQEVWSMHKLHGGISKLTLGGWQQSCSNCHVFIVNFFYFICIPLMFVVSFLFWLYSRIPIFFETLLQCQPIQVWSSIQATKMQRNHTQSWRPRRTKPRYACLLLCMFGKIAWTQTMVSTNGSTLRWRIHFKWMSFAKNIQMRGNYHFKMPTFSLTAAVSTWPVRWPCKISLPSKANAFSNLIRSSITGWCMRCDWVVLSTLGIWAVTRARALWAQWKRSCIPNYRGGKLLAPWQLLCTGIAWHWHTKLSMLMKERSGRWPKNKITAKNS